MISDHNYIIKKTKDLQMKLILTEQTMEEWRNKSARNERKRKRVLERKYRAKVGIQDVDDGRNYNI